MRALSYAPPALRANGRDLLESAIMRAQTAAHYADADLIQQAAALCNSIALNHPFVDGNKRSAFAACIAFLDANGLFLPADALRPFAEQLIAQHEATDRSCADAVLTEWLRTHLRSES